MIKCDAVEQNIGDMSIDPNWLTFSKLGQLEKPGGIPSWQSNWYVLISETKTILALCVTPRIQTVKHYKKRKDLGKQIFVETWSLITPE